MFYGLPLKVAASAKFLCQSHLSVLRSLTLKFVESFLKVTSVNLTFTKISFRYFSSTNGYLVLLLIFFWICSTFVRYSIVFCFFFEVCCLVFSDPTAGIKSLFCLPFQSLHPLGIFCVVALSDLRLYQEFI